MKIIFRRAEKLLALALTVVFCLLVVTVPLSANAEDISGHWAAKSINLLIEKGIVEGDSKGNINPDKDITRAEFVKLINVVFDFTEKDASNFPDVKPGTWYYDHFAIAKKYGYVQGYPDGNAYPGRAITRAEVSVALDGILELPQPTTTSGFKDSASFPSWSATSINALTENELIHGYGDNTFRASNNITRAEAFTILCRVIEQWLTIPEGDTPLADPGDDTGPGGGTGGTGGGGNTGGGGTTTYTVTFNTNGGSAVNSQSITAGGKVSKPNDPTKSGYVFAGWYADAALTSGYDFINTVVNANLTLYAKWADDVPGANPEVKVGQTVTVTVIANSLANIESYQFRLNYREEQLEYKKVTSKIPEMDSIFVSNQPMENAKQVGALIVDPNKSGVTGTNIAVCEMEFVSKIDGDLKDFVITLSDTRVTVKGASDTMNVTGWTLSAKVQD